MKAMYQALFVFLIFLSVGGHAGQDEEKSLESLKERVNERWGALIERDIELAYRYLTPTYRSLYTLEMYKKKVGVSVEWLGAKIIDVTFDGEHADVKLSIEYRLSLPGGVNDEIGQLSSIISEVWLWNAEEWWFIELNKSKL